jgi:hypothetical protein
MSVIEYLRQHIIRLNADRPQSPEGVSARNQAVWELEACIRQLAQRDGN